MDKNAIREQTSALRAMINSCSRANRNILATSPIHSKNLARISAMEAEIAELDKSLNRTPVDINLRRVAELAEHKFHAVDVDSIVQDIYKRTGNNEDDRKQAVLTAIMDGLDQSAELLAKSAALQALV